MVSLELPSVIAETVEAAFLCGAMAAELGLNEKQARRAALLHDIGAGERDGRVRVLVDASVDLDEILAGARRAGEVTRFSFEPPSLTDLFLEAVSEGRRA